MTSIIFEITERVEAPEYPCSTDQEALQYHYNDMLASGYHADTEESAIKEETQIWSTGVATIPALGNATPVHILTGTQNSGSGSISPTDGSKPIDFVGILFAVVRLKAKQTDILIYINVPHEQGLYNAASVDLAKGQVGSLLNTGLGIRDRIFSTFAIEDWSLFG